MPEERIYVVMLKKGMNNEAMIDDVFPIPPGEMWWVADGQATFDGEKFSLVGFAPMKRAMYVLREVPDEDA